MLNIRYKIDQIMINKSYTISCVLIKNLRHNMILGTPFIQFIQPFIVTNEGIKTNLPNKKLIFKFITKPQTRHLNTLQQNFTSELNYLISDKTTHLKSLQ